MMPLLLANALIPVFAGLLLGYAAGRRRVVDNINVKSLITFLMSFALPCTLYSAIAATDRIQLLGQGLSSVVLSLMYLVVFVLVYVVARKLLRRPTHDSAVLALTLGLPNATAVGLPLLLAAYGPAASLTTVASIAMGAITVSPLTLAILETRPDPLRPLRWHERIRQAFAQTGRRPDTLMGLAWRTCRKPVVWAPVLAIFMSLAGVHLPAYAMRTLSVMGAATAGTALFITGLIVSAQRFAFNRTVAFWLFTKNFLQPAIALGACHLFHLSLDFTRSIVLLCAIPCGFFGIVFGKNVNCTPPDASSTLVASYILGIFTLAGWIILLNHLH
jgi:predicted permease